MCNARNSSLEGQVIYLDMVLHVAEPRCPTLRATRRISAVRRARWPGAPLQYVRGYLNLSVRMYNMLHTSPHLSGVKTIGRSHC